MRNRKMQRQLKKQDRRRSERVEKPWQNSEGYFDPTAYAAILHMEQERRHEKEYEREKSLRTARAFS